MQITLEERVNIQAPGPWFQEARTHVPLPENRTQSPCLPGFDLPHLREVPAGVNRCVQRTDLVLPGDEQKRQRRQERHIGETRRWLLEEPPARHCQFSHRPDLETLGEQRRRSSGGVVAGCAGTLEDHHPAMLSQPVGGRGTRDTRSDHHEVRMFHVIMLPGGTAGYQLRRDLRRAGIPARAAAAKRALCP